MFALSAWMQIAVSLTNIGIYQTRDTSFKMDKTI